MTPIAAVDLLINRVLHFFESYDVKLLRLLPGRAHQLAAFVVECFEAVELSQPVVLQLG